MKIRIFILGLILVLVAGWCSASRYQLKHRRGAFRVNSFVFEAKATGENDTFTLPIYDGGSYNVLVDWGDAQTDTITAWNDGAATHTYAVAGTYQVMISGEIVGWRFNNTGSKDKIYDIKSWGPLRLGSGGGYFRGCSNLTVSATDVLDLTGTTDLRDFFRNCTSLTSLDVSSWDMALVINLSYTFYNCSSLTPVPTINNWDIPLVADATRFLQDATPMTTAAYDAVLIAWAAQPLQDNVVIHFGTATYTGGGLAAAAKAHLEAPTPAGHNWTITDNGIAP